MICIPETMRPGDGYTDPSVTQSSESLFKKKIEFHLARKPYTGISNGDFRLETLNPGSDSHKAVAIRGPSSAALNGNKSEGSEFLENGLDPELSFGTTFRRIGAGLENLGNTCFLNSVLQCLTYTEPLAAYLQSGKHQTSCRVAGFCALCAIQKHVSRALQLSGRSLAPKDLVSNLRCISRNFRNARQEDAHEYMVNLLESMHKCCLPSGVPSESPSAYDKSLVHKIFGGRLRSQVKCTQCSYSSNKFDPFLDLSLEIAKADSLEKALKHFTATEQLDGGERQYQCQRCKQKVRALKQLTVHKAPYVLTIHLKRFRAHDPGQKIDKKVQFSPTLDLKPFVSGSYEGDLKYTLYGVLVHHGWNTRSGHYYCFVRTSTGTWHSLDDNRVVSVGQQKVLEQKAYMLFYYRNLPPKKPAHVVQKEKMVANGLRNEMLLTANRELKGTVQNGSFEKKNSGADTSAAVTQRVVMNSNSSETQLKEESSSIQKRHCPASAESTSLNKDTQLESSLAPLKDHQGISVLNPHIEEILPLPQSAPSVKGSGDNSQLDNASAVTTGTKTSECNGERSSSKAFSVSVTTQSNCNVDKNTATENVTIVKTSQKSNCVTSTGVPSVTPSRDDVEKSVKIDPIRSPNKPSNENNLVGGIPNGSAAGLLPSEEAANTGLKLSVKGIIESSISPITLDGSSRMNAPNGSLPPDQKLHRKMKKKLLKCRVPFGSSILFGASLTLQKKKHKQNKKRTKSLKRELVEEINLGPSTSEKTRDTSLASTHPRKKRARSCSEDKHNGNSFKEVSNSNADSLMDVTDGEIREGTDQNGSVLAGDKLPHKSPSSSYGLVAANQCDAREPDGFKDGNRESMQNGLMSMLTRGLEETIVARWDGIDSPVSRDTSPRETGVIGYIPDEWDEEYDQGKRKKIRTNKLTFGGTNPFQEIASRKAQFKKARMDRSRSGNQPFRI